mmetsp:Transcript_24113/g.58237  ORF Transcript_24113/g.58237 Transcript_24113/m.58237 type:complete len:508 (+) Transcript_24113:157-1680(+)
MLTKKCVHVALLFVAIVYIVLQIQLASRTSSASWLGATLLVTTTAYSNAIPNNNTTTNSFYGSQATGSRPIRLIIHVGPPKTATTSIQCTLAKAEKSGRLSKFLSAKVVEAESCRPTVKEARLRFDKYKDQFQHLSNKENNITIMKDDEPNNMETLSKVIKGRSFIPECIFKWNGLGDDYTTTSLRYPNCWGESYLNYIQSYRTATKHSTFVISNEHLAMTFGKFREQTCKRVLDDVLSSLGGGSGSSSSTVEIIYTHRMFLDYLISMHSQEYGGDKFKSKPVLRKWVVSEEKEGKHTPALVNYVTEKMKLDFDLLSNSIKCLRLASNGSQRVQFKLIDYSDSGNVLQSFIRILTKGDESLASNIFNVAYQIRENEAFSKKQLIPSDRIALIAYTEGLIPTDAKGNVIISRGEARAAVKEVMDTLNTTQIKYRCPQKMYQPLLDQLLEKTIQLEQLAFPEREGVKEQVSQKFKNAINNQRLCDVDGYEMVKDAKLRSLLVEKFQSLR